jgi:SAM-dependent methyltransferase
MRALWDVLAVPGNSVLQIGPGSGHLLAAARKAGCSVAAVEPRKVHRDFIRDVWSMDWVYESMGEIPADRTFDTVVAINVLANVYDTVAFLSAVRQLLAPGGTCYLSTPNAGSLAAAALRSWWSMCKVHDHVSFPSKAGLATAALESGLRVGRIWSAELPLEFPVSAVVAARDRVRAHHTVAARHAATATGRVPDGGVGPAEVNLGRQAALSNLYSAASLFDPGYRVLGALGRAGSLQAMLTR